MDDTFRRRHFLSLLIIELSSNKGKKKKKLLSIFPDHFSLPLILEEWILRSWLCTLSASEFFVSFSGKIGMV